MKHLILILTIFSSSLIVGCGVEGEFDFAITKGSEHGQTKEVQTIEVQAPTPDPSVPVEQEAPEAEVEVSTVNARDLTHMFGVYQNIYDSNNEYSVELAGDILVMTSYINVGDEVIFEQNYNIDMSELEEIEVNYNSEMVQAYSVYDDSCNCEVTLIETDTPSIQLNDLSTGAFINLQKN